MRARLPFHSTLDQYEKEAAELLDARNAGDTDAIRVFHENHPLFLDSKITWLPKNLTAAEIRNARLEIADARLTLAHWYSFRDWDALRHNIEAIARDDSFESAVEAVINGDLETLEAKLRANPELVRARSTREHRATLLHYIAANGVEGYQQKTPPNAVAIATALLKAGSEVDALAEMYDGQYTTMSMLVSSSPPAEAGLQTALAETLIDFGAAVEPSGSAKWGSPLMTALAFGFRDTAEMLVRRGARVDTLPAAAGLGLLDDARRLLASADADGRHRALALAAQHGHIEIVRLLLDAGEDPSRYNPDGNHSHSTPIHQAILGNHQTVVRLLVERGARLDIKDTIYQSTPLGWANYAGKTEIAEYLRPLTPSGERSSDRSV